MAVTALFDRITALTCNCVRCFASELWSGPARTAAGKVFRRSGSKASPVCLPRICDWIAGFELQDRLSAFDVSQAGRAAQASGLPHSITIMVTRWSRNWTLRLALVGSTSNLATQNDAKSTIVGYFGVGSTCEAAVYCNFTLSAWDRTLQLLSMRISGNIRNHLNTLTPNADL